MGFLVGLTIGGGNRDGMLSFRPGPDYNQGVYAERNSVKAQGYDFSGSVQAWQRAARVIPGGVNSPVRAFGGVDEKQVVVASGRGCRITDIDGNEYIDYVGSWGPL